MCCWKYYVSGLAGYLKVTDLKSASARKQQLAEGQWTKRMMNEIRVWCKAEYGNKHFCSIVEGFISFQFFKEIKALLSNAMYTCLSCPPNCLLYSFLSFIFCEIQPHLVVLWTVPKQVHLVILKRKFGGNWKNT